MTLDQLRVFVAVAERQHVTQAARALNLAQSAVSHAVSTLEDGFQVKLFNRVGRGIELTEAGIMFLGEARAVLARAAAARLKLSELGELKRGTLLVHASQTIAGYWLPSRLMAFRAHYPQIEIRLAIGNTHDVVRQVHEGVAEIGFVEGAIDDPELASAVVAQDQLVLVVSPSHPWVQRNRQQKLRPSELLETDWILREPGSGTRSEFEAALERLGVSPHALRIALELPSNEAVRAAVESGVGATVISASVAAPSLEAELLHRVPLDLPQRHFQVVHHRERYLSRSAAALLSLLGLT
ncbi:LysR family transcriptional regulator [Lichenicoccus roseus]|uniref:LysR family transcriptional regulator n=1 Tax=Lichenicoccus roseus TaxID=2683649 RepID=A0A5R9J624_9PROT|nr:LysR family transcriptional regulator [Lichenicoccus roseus]TLU71061.1 LysR family transcriptional regulator [Lichenicoccus roseus]